MKALAADEAKLMHAFETVRKQLQSDRLTERTAQPLAYYVLPSDRRLPRAFLPRTISDLLDCSFGSLSAEIGIGQKKMASLVTLLRRAATEAEPIVEAPPTVDLVEAAPVAAKTKVGFDAEQVSEITWAEWRRTVRAHGLEHAMLGRLAPTLQALPTVIWKTPMQFYLSQSLAEIRQLKTHGEKRVRAVLEAFHRIHQLLGGIDAAAGLAVRLAPRFVTEIENWLAEVRQAGRRPSREELIDGLITPILGQLALDGGSIIAALGRSRLGIDGDPNSVREQARKLQLTRARIYQLLEECHHIMSVRWPEGKRQLDQLAQWLDEDYSSAEAANLLGSLRELLFPLKFDAVAKHLIADPRS